MIENKFLQKFSIFKLFFFISFVPTSKSEIILFFFCDSTGDAFQHRKLSAIGHVLHKLLFDFVRRPRMEGQKLGGEQE